MFKLTPSYSEMISQKISWGHWFTFFNIICSLLIGSRYAFIIDWPETLLGKLYFFISLIGHFGFIIFAFYLLILFPLSFILKNHRTFRGVSVILATLGLTLLLVDTEVFARFYIHLSSLVWNLVVNPDNGELARDWQIFFAPMPFILLIQMLFSRWSWQKLRSLNRQKWIRGVAVGFIFTFIGSHLLYAWADAFVYRPITMQKSTLPLSYPMTARRLLEKNHFIDKQARTEQIEQQGQLDALELSYPLKSLQYGKWDFKPNILLITIGGVSFNQLDEKITPTLMDLQHQGLSFDRYYNNSLNPQDVLLNLYYGLNNDYYASLLHSRLPPVFLSKLASEKYKVGLFSNGLFNHNFVQRAMLNGISADIVRQETNTQLINSWTKWLAQQNTSWFSHIALTISFHTKNQSVTQEQVAYAQQLYQMDTQIQQIIEQLKTQHQWQNTLLIVTSLGGYPFQFISENQRLNSEQLKMPFILIGKGVTPMVSHKLAASVDLAPTLMQHVLQVSNPTREYAQGENLFNLQRKANWILMSEKNKDVILSPNGDQYHIDKNGNYQKYSSNLEKISSQSPPLGLFLEVFGSKRNFVKK